MNLLYKGILRVAEFSPTIAQGLEQGPLWALMEFESPEDDQKEKLLKVWEYEKTR